MSSNNKRKRNGGKTSEVIDVYARVSTHSEHFLKFISGAMDTLNSREMNGRYIVIDNTFIHKVPEISKLIVARGHTLLSLIPLNYFGQS